MASLYLWEPSTITLPSSTLIRQLTPSALIRRRRSATGLKSNVVAAERVQGSDSLLFIVALPDATSMVTILPSLVTP